MVLILVQHILDPSATYWFYLYRNNSINHCVAKIAHPTDDNHQVESSIFIKSTGLDNFFIRTYCTGDTSFAIVTTQSFNQISFEYNHKATTTATILNPIVGINTINKPKIIVNDPIITKMDRNSLRYS